MQRPFKFKADCDSATSPPCSEQARGVKRAPSAIEIDLAEGEVVPDPADADDDDLVVLEGRSARVAQVPVVSMPIGPVGIMPIVSDVSLTEKERAMIERCRAAIRARRAAPRALDAAPASAATAPAIHRRQLQEPAPPQKMMRRAASWSDIEKWEQKIKDAIAWQQHNKLSEFWGFARFALKGGKHLQIRQVLMSWENPRAPQPHTHLADVQTQFMQDCCKDCFNKMAFQDLRLRAARKACRT